MKDRFSKGITALTLTLALVCPSFLFSCKKDMPEETTPLPETSGEIETSAPIDPDSIVYADEELPSVYITTEGGIQATSKDEYLECTFRLGLNDRYSAYSGNYTDDDGGDAKIRCRGNASYSNKEMRAMEKYSYKLKLDKKADILGMGESKHWYLINNWRDVSNLRHKFAYDMAGMLGLAHTDCTWVELYYNGEYRGLYLLTESIRIADDRVDTFDWEDFCEDVADEYAESNKFSDNDTALLEDKLKNDLSWISTGKTIFAGEWTSATEIDLTPYYSKNKLDLTSGYLIEYCSSYDSDGTKWKTEMNIPAIMDSPKMLHTNEEMYNYVHTLVQDFEDAVRSPNFYNSKGKHYSEYVDMSSLVDYWMVWNFTLNNEFGSRSMYYYIDKGKIHFGPIWDFDQTLGNVITVEQKNQNPSYWIHDKKNAWFKELFGDPWFTTLCAERWFEIREGVEDLVSSIDLYIDYMGEAAMRCYERNGVRYETIRNPQANNAQSLSPEQDFALIRAWLRQRIEWLDERFSATAPKVDSSSYVRDEGTSVSVTLGGQTLEYDNVTIRGIHADYVISPDTSGTLKIDISTSHSTTKSVDLYINGADFFGEKSLGKSNGASYEISTADLDMRDGAINVLFIPTYKADRSLRAMTSVLIRVSSVTPANENEVILSFRGEVQKVERGSTFVFPEIEAEREGYVPDGWSCDGIEVFRAGDEASVMDDTYYFIKWKRLDRFSEMSLSR